MLTSASKIHHDEGEGDLHEAILERSSEENRSKDFSMMTETLMTGNKVAEDDDIEAMDDFETLSEFDMAESAKTKGKKSLRVVDETDSFHAFESPSAVSSAAKQAAAPSNSKQAKKKNKTMTEPSRAVSDFGLDDRSSTSTAIDPEFGQFQLHDDVGYATNDPNNRGGMIVQKTMFTRRKLRACCLCLTLLIMIFILFQWSFTPKEYVAKGTCDDGMSAPYTRNRNVSRERCVTHRDPNWNNSELTDFLLPADKAAANPPIRFLVVGDFGRDGYCCQRDVADEMDRAARSIQADFVVNTGDSFYDGGIMTSSDEQVKTSFLNVYNQSYLRSLRFYSVLGNHEYRGSASAVMNLPELHNYRFSIGKDGSRWYTRVITGSSNMHLQLVFMDTSPMIDSYKIPGYDSPQDYMLQRSDGIKSQWSKVEDQMAWLEDRLQNERYPFIMRLVIGHHPVFDQTSHVGENRTFLQQRVAPLFEKYNVTAAFAGHDHNLQMVQPAKTAYFVSGAGSKIAPAAQDTRDSPDSAVRFYYLEHGFMACTVYLDELRVAVVNMEGNVLDKVIVKKRLDED